MKSLKVYCKSNRSFFVSIVTRSEIEYYTASSDEESGEETVIETVVESVETKVEPRVEQRKQVSAKVYLLLVLCNHELRSTLIVSARSLGSGGEA